MLENIKAPKRGWVKNAVIVFLAIMLLLTFFSNTIMNASLPEVSTLRINSGSISSAVRGSSTVTANDTYEVKMKLARTLESTLVRVGDTVEEGQILFTFQGESVDLTAARDKLQAAQDAYREAMINSAMGDNELQYAQIDLRLLKEDREELVEELKEDIAEAQLELDEAKIALADALSAYNAIESTDDAAKALVDQKTNDLTRLTRELEAAQDTLAKTEVPSGFDTVDTPALVNKRNQAYYDWLEATDRYRSMNESRVYTAAEISQALSSYNTAKNAYDTFAETADPKDPGYTEDLAELQEAMDSAWSYYDSIRSGSEFSSEDIQEAKNFADSLWAKFNELEIQLRNAAGYSAINKDKFDAYIKLQDNITALEVKVKSAKYAQEDAQKAYELINTDIVEAETDKTKAEAEEESAQSALKAAQDAEKNQLDTADDSIRAKEREIDKMILESQVSVDKESFEIEKLAREVSEAEVDLAEAEAEGETTEYASPVTGIVRSLPPSEISPDETVMLIEIPERGYNMTLTGISNEQAAVLQPGIQASMSGFYWGDPMVITLANIAPDPDDARNSKKLTFTVTGDTVSDQSGQRLDIEIGGRGSNYDAIVPNSAVFSDASGDFVLIIEEKGSPLGTRYIARRADVNVITKDDVNSAISGVGSNVFVITMSSAPVNNGQYVRLANE